MGKCFLSKIFSKKKAETVVVDQPIVIPEPVMRETIEDPVAVSEVANEATGNINGWGSTTTSKYSGKNFVVLLDNGHAKSTAGKRSPLFDDGKTRFYEWEFNRDVVSRIAKKLDRLGIKYHVLVPEGDYDVPLTTRANRANEYCKKYGILLLG